MNTKPEIAAHTDTLELIYERGRPPTVKVNESLFSYADTATADAEFARLRADLLKLRAEHEAAMPPEFAPRLAARLAAEQAEKETERRAKVDLQVRVKFAAIKQSARQSAKAQKPRSTIDADGEPATKKSLVEEALKQSGIESRTPEVWPHLLALLEAKGMKPIEDGAKDTRTIRATDGNGKKIDFTYKGVQTMLADIRKAPKGRPRKRPD